MKLVIVGWLAALVSFAIGYALGRRARRREMMHAALINAMGAWAVHGEINRMAHEAAEMKTKREQMESQRLEREKGP